MILIRIEFEWQDQNFINVIIFLCWWFWVTNIIFITAIRIIGVVFRWGVFICLILLNFYKSIMFCWIDCNSFPVNCNYRSGGWFRVIKSRSRSRVKNFGWEKWKFQVKLDLLQEEEYQKPLWKVQWFCQVMLKLELDYQHLAHH